MSFLCLHSSFQFVPPSFTKNLLIGLCFHLLPPVFGLFLLSNCITYASLPCLLTVLCDSCNYALYFLFLILFMLLFFLLDLSCQIFVYITRFLEEPAFAFLFPYVVSLFPMELISTFIFIISFYFLWLEITCSFSDFLN